MYSSTNSGVSAASKTAAVVADTPWMVPSGSEATPARTADVDEVPVVGAWAFRNRSWLPIPLGIAVVALSWSTTPSLMAAVAGLMVLCAGQTLRFWAVRHIGPISRTRAHRTGPLITTGPYALTRNPLYVGNWCLWTGVVMITGILWMLPVVWLAFRIQYGEIVEWEERLISTRLKRYTEYAACVPRWWPSAATWRATVTSRWASGAFSWREVLHSERGTLLAILATLLLILYPLARRAVLTIPLG
jgi:protein-S-isoprenylcysteine O-methyltransferase Ste14